DWSSDVCSSDLEDLFGLASQALLDLHAHQRRMHTWRFHLQGRQLSENFIGKNSRLQAQHLAELHGRTSQRPHLVGHSSGCPHVRGLQFDLALRFAEKYSLQQIPEITAG